MATLKINNLHVSIGDKEILKGIDLTIDTHEIHALMGPNGNGKSTLLSTIMGHPAYQITKGAITLDGKDITSLPTDERSRAGLFLAMQYPQEIPGVTNSDFLRAAMNARRSEPMRLYDFMQNMDEAVNELQMNEDLANRYLNEGFSGGEKKRNEILQMKLLKPQIALLDEIDSGLDVDALKIVSDSINKMHQESNLGLVIVSHYDRLYKLIKPSHVHILVDGKIVQSGDYSLAEKINKEGYNWLLPEKNNDDLYEKIFGFGAK